jgi:DNA-binding GntR family transcriptional regulator
VLSEDLGISSTPIREALRLLQSDKLVEYQPHRGMVVSTAQQPSIDDVYHLRILLESDATQIAVRRMSGETLDELERIHKALITAAHSSSSSRRRMSNYNIEWHWTIYKATGVPLLARMIENLWEAFPWRTLWAIPDTASTSVEDHEGMMAAIRRGDADAAADLMGAHLARGQAYMREEAKRRRAETGADGKVEAQKLSTLVGPP